MLKVGPNATILVLTDHELHKLRNATREGLQLVRREIANTEARPVADSITRRLELNTAKHVLEQLLNTLAS